MSLISRQKESMQKYFSMSLCMNPDREAREFNEVVREDTNQGEGISPIKALLLTAIAYGLTAPVLIAVILHIGNNKAIMKTNTNSRLSNILGLITLIIMTAAAIALIYFLLTG